MNFATPAVEAEVMGSKAHVSQQNQWKQNLIDDLLKIDFLGIVSCLLLLWIGAHYFLSVIKNFKKKTDVSSRR